MRRFVEGIDREQATLFPECLEDWIDQDNPVRAIDAFVDKLDLPGVGFDGVAPEATGRNSLYSTWDNQFYPDGVPGAEVMANASPTGGLELAKDYWVSFPDGYRAHQIRLEGGDCSTDSFCYPSV
jgi:hypothetical protein